VSALVSVNVLLGFALLATLFCYLVQPPVPAYAGTEGCFVLLTFFYLFFI